MELDDDDSDHLMPELPSEGEYIDMYWPEDDKYYTGKYLLSMKTTISITLITPMEIKRRFFCRKRFGNIPLIIF